MRPHRVLSRFKRGHRRRDDMLGEVYDQGVPQAVLGGSEGAHESRKGKVRNNHDYDDDDDDSRAPSRLSHVGRVADYHGIGAGKEQKDTPVRGS